MKAQAIRLLSVLLTVGLLVWAAQAMLEGDSHEGALDPALGVSEVLNQAQWSMAGKPNRQTRVRLPHQDTTTLNGPDEATYEMVVTVRPEHARSEPLGVCVTNWAVTGDLRLNGVRLMQSLPGIEGSKSFNRPTFVPLPPGMTMGKHALTVHVAGLPGLRSHLSPLWFGDAAPVRKACNELTESGFKRSFAPALLMALIGLAALVPWLVMKERSALYLFLIGVVWCVHALLARGGAFPMSLETWAVSVIATRIALMVPVLLFVLESIGSSRRGLKSTLVGAYFVAFLLLAVLPTSLRSAWLVSVGLASVILICGLLYQLIRHTLREMTESNLLLVGALGFGVANGAQLLMRRLGYESTIPIEIPYAIVPIIFTAFSIMLIERLVRSAQLEASATERMRVEVEFQRTQIAAHYEQQQQQRAALAVLEERRRIMQDMHDGLGSHLVSARAMVESAPLLRSEQMRPLIAQALDELRSVLDVLAIEPSTMTDDDPVAALLGSMRTRIEPSLKAQGITLEWHVDPLPLHFLSGDAHRLQLLRFLQEAVSNVLRHSRAHRMSLSASVRGTKICILVADDGCGIAKGVRLGVGLASMQKRAAWIGAQFELHSETGDGTRLELTWEQTDHPVNH